MRRINSLKSFKIIPMNRVPIFLTLVLSIILYSSPYAQDKNITVYTEQWPPYNFMENQELKGSVTDIVKKVLKKMDIKTQIELLPSARVMNVFKKSKKAIFFSLIMTPERKDQFKWIGPIARPTIFFYQNKSSQLKLATINDAKAASSICARDSGLVVDQLKALGFENIDTSATASSIYLKAILGRCELAISEAPKGYEYWMQKMNRPLDSLKQTSVYLINSPLYIAATKDTSDVDIMKWQRELDKILEKSN